MAVTEVQHASKNSLCQFRSYTSLTRNNEKEVYQSYHPSEKLAMASYSQSLAKIRKIQSKFNLKTTKFIDYSDPNSIGIMNLYVARTVSKSTVRISLRLSYSVDGYSYITTYPLRGDNAQSMVEAAIIHAWSSIKDKHGYTKSDLEEALSYSRTESFWQRLYNAISSSSTYANDLGFKNVKIRHGLQAFDKVKFISLSVSNDYAQVSFVSSRSNTSKPYSVADFRSTKTVTNYLALMRHLSLYCAFAIREMKDIERVQLSQSYVFAIYYQAASIWRLQIEESCKGWDWDLEASEFDINITSFIKMVDAESLGLNSYSVFDSDVEGQKTIHQNYNVEPIVIEPVSNITQDIPRPKTNIIAASKNTSRSSVSLAHKTMPNPEPKKKGRKVGTVGTVQAEDKAFGGLTFINKSKSTVLTKKEEIQATTLAKKSKKEEKQKPVLFQTSEYEKWLATSIKEELPFYFTKKELISLLLSKGKKANQHALKSILSMSIISLVGDSFKKNVEVYALAEKKQSSIKVLSPYAKTIHKDKVLTAVIDGLGMDIFEVSDVLNAINAMVEHDSFRLKSLSSKQLVKWLQASNKITFKRKVDKAEFVFRVL